MKKAKKLIPILIVIFVFGIYFIGKNIKFENNILKTKQLAGINDITDNNLKVCITSAVAGGDPSAVTELNCSNKAIYKLDGINYLPNLRKLVLNDNNITDLSPIQNLTQLTQLQVNNNLVKTFNFSNMILEVIQINSNYISDMSSLGLPTTIKTLLVNDNKIKGNVDLTRYTGIISLGLANNEITGIKLGSNNLVNLYVGDNDISSIDDITIGNTSIADSTEGIANSLKNLNLNGITWDTDVEQLIINNNSTLEKLELSNTGITDASFFYEQGDGLGNLNSLTLSHNDLNINKLNLTKLHISTFTCDNCGLDAALNGKINVNEITTLNVPNNSFSGFHTHEYPNLVNLNIAGNKLIQFTNQNTNVRSLDLSHAGSDFGASYLKTYLFQRGGIGDFASVEKLYLRNIGLEGTLDFHLLTNLKELYIDNCTSKDLNNVGEVILKGNLEVLDASNNAGFSSITLFQDEPQNGQEPVTPTLPRLEKLSLNFTSVEEIITQVVEGDGDNQRSVILYPSLKELNVIGCTGLTVNGDSNDLKIEPISSQIEKLSIGLSGLGSGYVLPESLPSLRELVVDSRTPSAMYTDTIHYPQLSTIRAVSSETKYILTSKNAVSADAIGNLAPSYITNQDYEEIYDYYTDVDYRKTNSLAASSDRVHYIAKKATITNLNNYNRHTAYDGYYRVNIIKVSSSSFKFDDNNMIIFVGDTPEEEILDKITLPEGASASIENGKVIISAEDREIGRYTISHTMPAGDPSSEGGDIIDSDDSYHSEDPTLASEYSGSDYGTIENPDTGTIISFIVIVLLIASGIVGSYYMKLKKKNEELIEKI